MSKETNLISEALKHLNEAIPINHVVEQIMSSGSSCGCLHLEPDHLLRCYKTGNQSEPVGQALPNET